MHTWLLKVSLAEKRTGLDRTGTGTAAFVVVTAVFVVVAEMDGSFALCKSIHHNSPVASPFQT